MGDVRIRAMRQEDLGPVGALAGGLVRLHHHWDADRFFLTADVEGGYRWFFGTQLGLPEVVLLVAEREGRVVGYAYATVEARDWNRLLDAHGALHDVAVEPGARRQGVGRALVQATVQALEALGAPRVVLMSATQNADAQALFASLGFRPTMVEMTRTRP